MRQLRRLVVPLVLASTAGLLAACIPATTNVTPTYGPTTGGTVVTITGAFFTSVTAVKFGTMPAASFTVTSTNAIKATTEPHAAGTVKVSLTNSTGTTVWTGEFAYVQGQSVPAPVITAFSPTVGSIDGGTTVTITGDHLSKATAVKFGTIPATTFKVTSATTITAKTKAHPTGTVKISVTTAGGIATTANQFTYQAAAICGSSTLQSPYNSGNDPELGTTSSVVTIATGTDSGPYNKANTTYYFAPGTHTIGEMGMGKNDWYVGEYSGGTGATITGGSSTQYGLLSLRSTAVGSTIPDFIEYLTITGYTAASVGFGTATSAPYPTGAPGGLTLKYSTIKTDLPGTGVEAGSNDVIEDNCLQDNGDYAINTFCSNGAKWSTRLGGCPDDSTLTTGPQNVTVEDNEVAGNDACNFTAVPAAYFPITRPSACGSSGFSQGCGCAGGVHFWNVEGSYVENNYIHTNWDTATWWDTDNDGETITGNYYSGNWGSAVDLEISYNALVSANTFKNNGWGAAECAPSAGNVCYTSSNLAPAVYVSESGGYSTVPNPQGYRTVTIGANHFTDNWDGVSVYQDGNRFCGGTNTSVQFCTLAPTSTPWWNQAGTAPTSAYFDNQGTTGNGCGKAKMTGISPSSSPDYWDNCMWKAQNVSVKRNVFNFTKSAVHGCPPGWPSCGSTSTGETCTTSGISRCAANGISGNCSSGPSWSPYKALSSTGPCGSTGNAMIDMVSNCRAGDTYTGCTSNNNYFSDNAYSSTGISWTFMWPQLNAFVSASTWQTDGQDSGSTF